MLAENVNSASAGLQEKSWSSELLLLSLRCHRIAMVQRAESRKGLNLAFTRRANFCGTTCWRDPSPVQDASGPHGTTEVCNAHKTSLREVKYRWHPWHGKTVLVRGEACRGGHVVLQCVRDELKGFPTLEIPEWMFDSRVCSRMYSTAFPHVDCASLLALKHLISAATGSSELNVVQAQHPGKSGDADAQNVSVQNPSRQIVFSTREASRVTSRSTTEDGPTAGQDAERILAAPPLPRREKGAER